ncbi:AMP-dependent synthetase and ligase [Athelia psychrophila]|uniref:AMP-dependent synthetase and ligase n=1 Tax=Athelia psychrophila TaxID=1759441 RepID=A0A166AFI9_9AGAM|nr:AMP-dependent synthetase and ligase [Fibularhizoctonia sp. CBS 109695]
MVVLPTGPENALALLALASYHTCAPINASCTAAELLDDAERLRAKCVFTTRDAEDRLELLRLRDELGCEIVYLEPRSSGPCGLFDMSLVDGSEEMSFDDENPPTPSRLHGLSDVSLILHTSGTSGKKKVVPYSLRSLVVGTCAVALSWDLTPSDVNMNMMPLFHVGGIVRNLLAPMFTGGSSIMCAGFDSIAFWTLSVELKATWYYAAPTLHHAILSSQPEDIVPSRDMRIRMICNAAGGLLPSLAIELRDTFGGAAILPSYGMTECMPIASPLTSYKLDRPGCSGVACGPHLSIRHPLDRERELAVGETGAVSVRGLPTFEGYEVSPDQNVALDVSAFSEEGWFDSGDMGYMDADGYLYITGRSKEIINKGGEVISPFEVEEAVMTVAKDRVKTNLAFAIEHDVLQETIGLAMVPNPNHPRLGLAELHDLLRDVLHPSKWPFAIVYMEDLPRNAAGKPLRIKLASRLGIGMLSDGVPALHRHFEANTPGPEAALSDPIPCSRVSVDFGDVEGALMSIIGVEDVAIRFRGDGTPEAFVSTQRESGLDAARLRKTMSRVLPGYGIPEMYAVEKKFERGEKGQIDFAAIEAIIKAQNSSSMSEQALLVRDIVANLLLTDPGMITADSDFFLLGGNSLLLGKLSYFIRKQMGANVAVADIFTNSTIEGIASLVQAELKGANQMEAGGKPQGAARGNGDKFIDEDGLDGNDSNSTLGYEFDLEDPIEPARGQNHPLSLIVQILPIVFFYPLKAAYTWAILLWVLAVIAPHINNTNFWERNASLLCAITVARLSSRIISPIAAILFKWLVIQRYQPGMYRMWSVYHLRWWIVNQALRNGGKGVFAMSPGLTVLYWRMLGAKIGKNVKLDAGARLGEADLLELQDGCAVDAALVRGFCVERDGFFRLDRITIGKRAVINTFTSISPGAVIKDGEVFGPHASSFDDPSHKGSAAFNRALFKQPSWRAQVFFAWPVIIFVMFASYVPWFASLWLMTNNTVFIHPHLNAIESVIYWFADPERVMWHAVSRIIRAIATPLLQVIFGIILKRIMGLNKEGTAAAQTNWVLTKRYINSTLLSQFALKRAFDILGTHYEMTSVVFRAMGAKVGNRVYWPGSGIYCLDPELLEIGNDVVFGSRSEIFTTDRIGTAKIVIENGAMIADRVVLLPGTRVGVQTVMGSGAQGRRDTDYQDGSTWMGNDHGEAICFNRGTAGAKPTETITPFGKAYYKREAPYFVFPYALLVLINLFVAALSATYWSISAVAAAQLLRQFHIHLTRRDFFSEHWYQFGTLYGLIACCFVVVLNIQAMGALLWAILTKWVIIGQRKEGRCAWNESSYCQRWQLHLTLCRPLYRGYGNGGILGPLTGSAYIVWYFRALGADIGKNVALFAGGKTGLMTEPDLVQLGDDVTMDDCSVVAHINSRGNFALNRLSIAPGCALRAGSRLLSGASMEDSSMLVEHTLLTSGEIAESGEVYVGWPARQLQNPSWKNADKGGEQSGLSSTTTLGASLMCPMCREFPRVSTVTMCGHVFCDPCITNALAHKQKCPVCMAATSRHDLMKIYPTFVL